MYSFFFLNTISIALTTDIWHSDEKWLHKDFMICFTIIAWFCDAYIHQSAFQVTVSIFQNAKQEILLKLGLHEPRLQVEWSVTLVFSLAIERSC